VLAAAGADVHYTKSGTGETALYYACLQGRLAAVKALIASNARHSDALFDNQETPLHCAAMGGHAQVVTELLKAGAKHDATKSDIIFWALRNSEAARPSWPRPASRRRLS
jgi:ankyrin repeat protein